MDSIIAFNVKKTSRLGRAIAFTLRGCRFEKNYSHDLYPAAEERLTRRVLVQDGCIYATNGHRIHRVDLFANTLLLQPGLYQVESRGAEYVLHLLCQPPVPPASYPKMSTFEDMFETFNPKYSAAARFRIDGLTPAEIAARVEHAVPGFTLHPAYIESLGRIGELVVRSNTDRPVLFNGPCFASALIMLKEVE